MSIEIANGSLVHRIWGDNSEPEFLAYFTYSGDAETFAQASLASHVTSSTFTTALVVTHTYSGKMQIFRPKPVEPQP
jgi:hypothetical protein